MSRLPAFDLRHPETLDEAVALLAEGGAAARVLGGGTDLLVNLRHRTASASLLVSLGRIAALRGVRVEADGAISIGAAETLAHLAAHPEIRARATALSQAAARVAHPQARSVGTIGGNVCLDVRCRWVNRSDEWREALGGCLKVGGDSCHVVAGGQKCVAALCGDTVPALVALGAEATIHGPAGERRVNVADVRAKGGERPLSLADGEILAAVHIPPPQHDRVSAYAKWSVRQAVDFPLVSLGFRLERDARGAIAELAIVAGALGPKPRRITGLERFTGERLTAPLARAVAEEARRQCVPLPNVLSDPAHRRRLIGVLVERQLAAWADAP